MKNREKFKDEILNLACKGVHFGVDKRTGNVISCHSQNGCSWCIFCSSRPRCAEEREKWCEQEEEKISIPKKTPVDTVIMVRNSLDEEWSLRHFAGFTSEGKVLTYSNGYSRKSSDELSMCYRTQTWTYAKLYENLTNLDVYKEKLLLLMKENRCITLKDGEPCLCREVGCNNCKAVTCHTDTLKDWLESPYKGE